MEKARWDYSSQGKNTNLLLHHLSQPSWTKVRHRKKNNCDNGSMMLPGYISGLYLISALISTITGVFCYNRANPIQCHCDHPNSDLLVWLSSMWPIGRACFPCLLSFVLKDNVYMGCNHICVCVGECVCLNVCTKLLISNEMDRDSSL